jgi:hypothetical protein
MAKAFSDHAREKLMALYHHHEREVGSVLKAQNPDLYQGLSATDCITYAINVMGYAFKQVGDDATARKVQQLGKHGNELSRYLVTTHRWLGIYINPDVKHPIDADPEHVWSDHVVNKTCTYFSVPIKYRTVNFGPTPSADPSFQKVSPRAPATPMNDVDIKALSKVDFGFGISRGARHTWLFSLGNVYEVHWDQIGAQLYERTSLQVFGWLSGAIVVPPDRASFLTMSAQVCRR